MTPAQLNVYAKAHTQRLQQTQRITQVNIYNLASLIRSMVWGKSPPGLRDGIPGQREEGARGDG